MNRLSAFRPLTYLICCLALCILFTSSCTTNKKITYFQDMPDSLYAQARNIKTAPYQDPIIKPSDLLQISILTLDPQSNVTLTSDNTTTYATQVGSSNVSTNNTSVSAFLVDNDGMVEVPIIGKIKVAGLTTSAARDSIHNRVSVYYKQPVVNVRYANFTITVMGEVARPATYTVPTEKVSILDAIGMAGDLTIFGKRENVMLMRDSAGVRQIARFDLNSTSTITSPYFYLKQGDIVYVEPSKSKIVSSDAVRTRNITLAASGLSLLIVLITRL